MASASTAAASARLGLLATRLTSLVGEAWQHARRRRRRMLVAAVALAGVTAAVLLGTRTGGGAGGSALKPLSHQPILEPVVASRIGKHEPVVVAITAHRSTGVFGEIRRAYLVESLDTHPGIACVNNRTGAFPSSSAGSLIRAVLNPAAGDGGPQGWCPGTYRGVVIYTRGFNCGAVRVPCDPPSGLASKSRIVARFSYRVR